MKYRDAKKLQSGDEVIRKEDKVSLTVKEVHVFGQYKKVQLHCVTPSNASVTVYHDEIE